MPLKVNDKIVFREIDGCIVLVNLENGNYYSLNEVGSLIFKLLLKNKNWESIEEEIRSTYKLKHGNINNDISDFIKDMTKENILLEARDKLSREIHRQA